MYELTNYELQNPTLSLDPGSTSMGIAVAGMNEGKIVIPANAVMHNPIKGLTKDLINKKHLFLSEIEMWVQTYKVETIVVERFQSRGLMGNTGEEVSMMIGILLHQYDYLNLELIIASTWKTRWKRNFKLDLKDLYKICSATPHQVDAVLMGLFYYEKYLGYYPNYDPEHLMRVVGKANLTKHYNRRFKTLQEVINAKTT